MLLSLIGMGIGAFILITSNQEYQISQTIYEDIRNDYTEAKDQSENKLLSSEKTSNLSEEEGRKIDFTGLQKMNPDVIGWIESEGSPIDYPVVQGNDNSYYLTHMYDGTKNKSGSIFMDYRNKNNFSDRHTVIYGHNMDDGSMFQSLLNYESQSYYDKMQHLTLYTPHGNYQLEPFAGKVENGDQQFVRLDFLHDKDFLQYLKKLKTNSTFQSDVTISEQDRIISLITCSYRYDNARYALYCKLIKK